VTAELERRGVSVLYDDRRKVSPGVKFKDAELIGVPTIVVLGRNLADGTVEVRDRRTGDKRDVVVAQAVDQIVAEVLGASTP
jgi:prolyl-tRNA synthetase